jgi:hypothetical protein
MAKAKTALSTKKAHKSAGCKGAVISFTTKRGRKVEFKGKAGKSCGPRKTSTSASAKAVRKLLAAAGKQCGKRFGYFTKASGKCVRDAFKSSYR